MSTFITKLDSSGDGPRLAVKDLIDVEGVPTTAGCRAIERDAKPAERDAPCLAGARGAGARIVGKTNLHELAMLPIGTNPWFGNPVNPLDPALIPGGSSSGSATAVAYDEADVALGSDTGGSVRIPAACCGITGLKTTHGRIPLDGVYPLAPGLDTIGPMATTIAGLELGMRLLEPGFIVAPSSATTIGRIRTSGDPIIEDAVDAALRAAEFDVIDLAWSDFEPALTAFGTIYFAEVWAVDHELVAAHPDGVGLDITETVATAYVFRGGEADARASLATWMGWFERVFDRVELLALPTLPMFPPRLDQLTPENMFEYVVGITQHVALFNAAGAPATAQPSPAAGSSLPASLQLVGGANTEDLLLATAARVEAAV